MLKLTWTSVFIYSLFNLFKYVPPQIYIINVTIRSLWTNSILPSPHGEIHHTDYFLIPETFSCLVSKCFHFSISLDPHSSSVLCWFLLFIWLWRESAKSGRLWRGLTVSVWAFFSSKQTKDQLFLQGTDSKYFRLWGPCAVILAQKQP